ncbi:MAG: isoprenylcysteine carboxylmethyltransferase family protein [Methylobacterium sp.]|jgi:protein-S-isoprenylcysteine O-methyltransferase Ste14|uniref:methyltransferase family protein n=1 Tax=Methylobacterium sp. TaxID=409 RepID=UPI002583311A|nr:isoprenylcysteine carboxylmethyltransferase family protein [Methylobacterium sp.]MBY0295449.1 isoprenylcysteine carboxylmethyltransferase family protein [Methylobacterium sp.]
MATGYALVITGLILIAKGWRAVLRPRGRLLTDGIYARMRHPQYSGLFLAVLDQLIHWPTIPTLLLSPVIVWLYVDLARREEKRLLAEFGDRYASYRQRVPMFFPALTGRRRASRTS